MRGSRADPVRRYALLLELRAALGAEVVDGFGEARHERGIEGRLDRALAQRAHVRQPHAVGRQHARQRMHQDPPEAERIGDQAGVLAGGAAKAAQHVATDVVAALDRDPLDRVRHVVDRDREAAVRDLLGRARHAGGAADLGGQGGEFLVHDRDVGRLVGIRPEHLGKETRLQLADHQVGVGDGQRAALAIAGRAGIGARRFGPDAKAGAIEGQDRAAAGCHRVDRHHRRAHAHACDLALEAALESAGIVGDIRRGAAHVEGDDLLETGERADPHGTDDAAGRARQDGVLAPEHLGVDQAAVALHEHQPHVADRARHLVDIAAEDRRQIGIDHRRVAAADHLHQRRDLVADRDLGEAHLARQRRQRLLVIGVAVAVQEHDRDRPKALREAALQAGAGALEIERPLDRAVGAHALGDLDHVGVEQLRQHDPTRKDVGTMLVADAQRVGEALGDRERGRLAAALEQARWSRPWCPS